MNLCKNCKYCKLEPMTSGDLADYSKCTHSACALPMRISLVNGNPLPKELPYCEPFARSEYSGMCGKEGRLFEPSEAYAEYLRDRAIDERADAKREADYDDCDFERDCGARY